MGIMSKLFSKKPGVYDRFEPTEEQEDFLKEDSKSAEKKKSAPKKATAAPQAKKVANTTEKKKTEPKKAAEKAKSDPKKATQKPKSEPKKVAEKAKVEPKKNAQKTKVEDKKTVQKPKAEPKKTSTKDKAEPKKTAIKSKAEPKKTDPKKSEKAAVKAVAQELQDDSPEVKGAVAVQESKETANGKFDIRRAKDGRYFFSLYASNHAVIAYSQIYSSISAVTTGINSVIANAPKAAIEDTTIKNPTSLPCPKWEIYIDKAGQYRFRLYASNGLCVCHASHGYTTKGACKGGMDSIKRFSAEAKVDKSYLK